MLRGFMGAVLQSMVGHEYHVRILVWRPLVSATHKELLSFFPAFGSTGWRICVH